MRRKGRGYEMALRHEHTSQPQVCCSLTRQPGGMQQQPSQPAIARQGSYPRPAERSILKGHLWLHHVEGEWECLSGFRAK